MTETNVSGLKKPDTFIRQMYAAKKGETLFQLFLLFNC